MSSQIPNAPFWVYKLDDNTLDEVHKLIFHNASDQIVKDKVKELTGVEVTTREVNRYKTYLSMMEGYMIKHNEAYHKRYMDACFKAVNLITKEIELATERRQAMRDSGEYKIEKDYFNILSKDIELLAKLKGEIQSVTNIVNADKAIVNIEINQTIQKKVLEFLSDKAILRDDDVIEILSPELAVMMKRKKKRVAVGEDSSEDDE